MDIAYFISDLLGEQGELSVPNLGYFVQLRMGAFYNEQEKKFYPPHYAVQFDPQVIDDDDTLATHITEKKKISLASAKYFIEKYITGLREQALTEEVPFGGIGYFSTNGIQLVFRPDAKTDDPSFFGFKPVGAYRIGTAMPEPAATPDQEVTTPAPTATPELVQPPFVAAPEPEPTPAPAAYVPPVVEPPVVPAFPPQLPVQEESETEYAYEEERRGMSAWLIVAIVLVVLVGAAFALYKVKPELFRQLSLHKDPYESSQIPKDTNTAAEVDTAIATPVDTVRDTVKPQATNAVKDTRAIVEQDKTAAPTASTADKAASKPVITNPKKAEAKLTTTTVKQPVSKPTATIAPVSVPATATTTIGTDVVTKGKWVIYGGAFPERKPALRALENYKSLGQTQARFLKDNVKPGNNYKIILGVFDTKKQAQDARIEILATAKISASRLGVEQLK